MSEKIKDPYKDYVKASNSVKPWERRDHREKLESEKMDFEVIENFPLDRLQKIKDSANVARMDTSINEQQIVQMFQVRDSCGGAMSLPYLTVYPLTDDLDGPHGVGDGRHRQFFMDLNKVKSFTVYRIKNADHDHILSVCAALNAHNGLGVPKEELIQRAKDRWDKFAHATETVEKCAAAVYSPVKPLQEHVDATEFKKALSTLDNPFRFPGIMGFPDIWLSRLAPMAKKASNIAVFKILGQRLAKYPHGAFSDRSLIRFVKKAESLQQTDKPDELYKLMDTESLTGPLAAPRETPKKRIQQSRDPHEVLRVTSVAYIGTLNRNLPENISVLALCKELDAEVRQALVDTMFDASDRLKDALRGASRSIKNDKENKS